MEAKSPEQPIPLYTSAEVAQYLKMSPQVVARKLQAGELEGYKIGKDWRVSLAHLQAFLESRSNKNAPQSSDEKLLRTFFENGKLKSIPTARGRREKVLRYLVSQLDPTRVYTEAEINEFVNRFHPDVCTIRREFIINKLMVRSGGKYKVTSWNR